MGGSKRSERPEAEPGEKGESQSRSMSIGEEPLAETSRVVFAFGLTGRAAETLGGRFE